MPGDRIPCCVPFCRRTRRNDIGFEEWICDDHWRAVPAPMRRVYSRALRRYRRGVGGYGEPESRLWRRLRRAAVEAAAGL